jgi:hypothetical protein
LVPHLTADAVGIRQEQYGIAGPAELDSLGNRGEETAAPASSPTIGSVVAGKQYDEPGKVFTFAAEAR